MIYNQLHGVYKIPDTDKRKGSDYIKDFYDWDRTSPAAHFTNAELGIDAQGSTEGWNDLWAGYYAYADPQKALDEIWTMNGHVQGESDAHIYHHIKSMIDRGTPDLSYTCDSALGSVFVKNNTPTYIVYNPDSTAKNVTFTSSTGAKKTVSATPNAMTIVEGNDKLNYRT